MKNSKKPQWQHCVASQTTGSRKLTRHKMMEKVHTL
jgi:hypothetical protein